MRTHTWPSLLLILALSCHAAIAPAQDIRIPDAVRDAVLGGVVFIHYKGEDVRDPLNSWSAGFFFEKRDTVLTGDGRWTTQAIVTIEEWDRNGPRGIVFEDMRRRPIQPAGRSVATDGPLSSMMINALPLRMHTDHRLLPWAAGFEPKLGDVLFAVSNAPQGVQVVPVRITGGERLSGWSIVRAEAPDEFQVAPGSPLLTAEGRVAGIAAGDQDTLSGQPEFVLLRPIDVQNMLGLAPPELPGRSVFNDRPVRPDATTAPWSGEFRSPQGYRYVFEMTIDGPRAANGVVRGKIIWELLEAPATSTSKVDGVKRTEFIEGVELAEGLYIFFSYRKEAPDLFAGTMGPYRIRFSSDAKTLRGLTSCTGYWNCTMAGTRP